RIEDASLFYVLNNIITALGIRFWSEKKLDAQILFSLTFKHLCISITCSAQMYETDFTSLSIQNEIQLSLLRWHIDILPKKIFSTFQVVLDRNSSPIHEKYPGQKIYTKK
ncbi:hypothetical protein ACJX0J_016769, partial [Zea mays]